ncbi:MAG: hypothetical protein HZT43_09945 [Exiguobacterium profundum]|nr:MAG: hypothetical protein HZT43_09945 [Exiguobacterium profundum]
MLGGANDDTLSGAGGLNTLYGGLGDDVFVVNQATDVIVEAGAGYDRVTTTALSFSSRPGSRISSVVWWTTVVSIAETIRPTQSSCPIAMGILAKAVRSMAWGQ